MGDASGVFNLVEGSKGSFGVAFSATLLFAARPVSPDLSFRKHYALQSCLPGGCQRTHNFLQMNHPAVAPSTGRTCIPLPGGFAPGESMLLFNDTFYILAITTAILIPLAFMLRKGRAGAPPPGAMH